MLHTQAHERRHQLVVLQVHSARQDARLKRLMVMVGLFKGDLERPDALTSTDKLVLLRVRRVEN